MKGWRTNYRKAKRLHRKKYGSIKAKIDLLYFPYRRRGLNNRYRITYFKKYHHAKTKTRP